MSKNRSPEDNPRERRSDGGRFVRFRHVMVRENWYRDVWLFVITLIVLLAVSDSREASRSAQTNAAAARSQAIQTGALANQNRRIVRRIDSERERTSKQFCRLINGSQADRVRQLRQTREYLQSPTGHISTGETGGINNYIRQISVPRLREQISQERKRTPRVCRPQPKIVQDFRNPDRRLPGP